MTINTHTRTVNTTASRLFAEALLLLMLAVVNTSALASWDGLTVSHP